MEDAGRTFQEAAIAFCQAVKGPALDAREVLAATVALIGAALQLPDVEPGTEAAALDAPGLDDESEVVGRAASTLGVDGYWEVFDPRALDEPVAGSLTDDLVDIYRDVRRGLALAEGSLSDAVWEWKFSYETHWGNHATDAVRVLHRVVTG